MFKYLSIIALVAGMASVGNAGASAASAARYQDIASKLQFWDLASGQQPVYYGKVTKNGRYYQCIAIGFVKAANNKIDYVFKMWAASPHSASGDCKYQDRDGKLSSGVGSPACLAQPKNKKHTRDMSLDALGIIAKQPAGYYYRTLDFNLPRWGSSKATYGRAGLLQEGCTIQAIDDALTAQKGADYYKGRLTTGMINVEVENGMFKMVGTNGLTYMVNTDDPRNLLGGDVPPSTKFNVK